jgi:putative endonuclease
LSVFRGNVQGSSSVSGRIGTAAEDVVCDFLVDQGCELLARNVHVGHLELDIVARLGAVALVVEVRSRGAGAWTSGLGSIGTQKRRRVRAAGERLWDRKLKYDGRLLHLRFDVASVTFNQAGPPTVEYIAAAF